MTREEAILLLHDMKDTYDEIHENTSGEIGYEQMTAIDMAIEALLSVPNCQKCAIKELWEETEKEDLVSVVRCKDCYHAEDDITHMFCVYFHHKVYEDDFCSNAVERREESEVEE